MNQQHVTPRNSWSFMSQSQLGWLGSLVFTHPHDLICLRPVPTSQGHQHCGQWKGILSLYLPHKALGLL